MAPYDESAAPSTISNSPQQSNIAPTPAATSSAGPGSTGVGGGGLLSAQHKRVYQACIPCRRRKVRCDLGSVDDPHDPPCVRCRRESKECFFSATRRKRKNEEADDEPVVDDYIVRNGRKRLSTVEPRLDPRLYTDHPLTPGASARSQPLRRPDGSSPISMTGPQSHRRGASTDLHSRGNSISNTNNNRADEPNTQLENIEAQTVMRAGVYGPHDALDLLYKAATNNTAVVDPKLDMPPRSRRDPRSQSPRLPVGGRLHNQRNSHQPATNSAHTDPGQSSAFSQTAPHIDPQLSNRGPEDQPGYAEAVKAWTRFRFVRAGWFTAVEAIEYIDYYYEYLSPLTPISPPTFRNPASHITLLTEEPILTVTLLTIASRYRQMPGTGGHCRSHAIHEQLWSYLRGMIERCLWGQEAFGGGFCGSGADESQTSSTAPWRGLRKGSLRTLGTIESLMILTEWHPRALHFPPAEAIDELMLPAYDAPNISADVEGDTKPGTGVGGRRIESWLEPAWRSDRMCWMLLSTAMGLAYELGVFDDLEHVKATGGVIRPEYEDDSYRIRSYRIKRLLLIYLSQLAGRLGWTSMVPESLRRSDPAVSRKRPTSVEGTTPGTSQSVVSNTFNYIPDLELDDQIIHCWAGISNLMHVGNEKLFRSRQHTTEIIQSHKYLTLLQEFLPMLKDWYTEFERFKLPPYIRYVLSIEYEYVRIYVNSLSLQAVVERCANNPGFTGQGGNAGGTSAPQLSPQTQNYFGTLSLAQLGSITPEDQEYIREVVDGSRNLLRIVVHGLLPGDYLKHAPVRTYFRIISGAMFLLKTFALGATRSDVETSIGLMDQTVSALRNCVVDDVHLGIRFADLLESLTSRLRNRFIHVSSSNDGRSPNQQAAGDAAAPGPTASANGGDHSNGDGQPWAHPHKLPDRLGTPANVSATPFEVVTSNMPYGSGSALAPSTPAASGSADPNGLPAMSDVFDSADWNTPGNEMWYLPAGPAFFQNMDGNAVAMTAEGVNVGGVDLLEYMAMDQFPVPDTSNGF